MTIYGKSAFSLARDLFYDPKGEIPGRTADWEEAKQKGIALVDKYMGTFTGLKAWIDNDKRFAYEHGYSCTMFGRRRRLPNLKSRVDALRANAERQAVNAPIQGTGSDLTMLSLISINQQLKDAGMKSMLVATVHDSLVMDVYIPEIPRVVELVKSTMSHVHEKYIDTPVPIDADVELGASYGEVYGISPEVAQTLGTPEAYREWLHSQRLKKYTKEMGMLHDKGWTKQQVIDYLQQYHRPEAELRESLEALYL